MSPVSALDRKTFVNRFGGVYEHSIWIAESTWDRGLTPREDAAAGLHAAMIDIVDLAGREPQLRLLCAHPDLAGKRAIQQKLTTESEAEQASAGLDECSVDELSDLKACNARYRSLFGFPYILAVRGQTVQAILGNFRSRIKNDPATEFQEALSQVHQIALLRLKSLLD